MGSAGLKCNYLSSHTTQVRSPRGTAGACADPSHQPPAVSAMNAGESSGCTKLIGDLRKALSGEDSAKPAAVNRCATHPQVRSLCRF